MGIGTRSLPEIGPVSVGKASAIRAVREVGVALHHGREIVFIHFDGESIRLYNAIIG